ncbi:2-C-methyl-D-erythritol 2,4-cyclodiphosphate synthase [Candidatus Aminicenantes bacterium AC-335-B20]|nr:2-C-methyl-D-erythritol 2,4-cyclodiphosphate synthase [SCandidatus Aminicenantes bacterium Aminicenantia_JdfR_composite]MCP2596687.1 2-C-methyl-D-erythritol 2,4-cyclodiphosphate synthase [Candidatus Aminicenantes bacterium AC-335-G13]MCP2598931.1 2-C-methyl-D-erythritol 2,4-cyclodiphosphate synthase [Candidatus Aminicenantes bacterium AC-335-B20]
MKIGIGYDIHRFEENRKLYLGGVEIPFYKGLIGHSDGDVLIHAIIDAILGALGEKDIGQLFPDTDPEYKGISSLKLLEKVIKIVKDKKAKILNIDSVIITEEPKLSPYINSMKRTLSHVLELEESSMGIKAKTNEGLGEIGEGKAIATYAIALIKIE